MHGDVTHAGLYVFGVDTNSNPNVTLTGKLLKDTPINGYYPYSEERSVIQGGTVHYIHDSQITSSSLSDLQ